MSQGPVPFLYGTSNLAWRRRAASFNGKKCKIASKWVMWGSRYPILEFCDPPNISRTVGARNFKFGTETDVGDFWVKRGHVGATWPNFGFMGPP